MSYDSRPDTYAHIQRVRDYIDRVVWNLLGRASEHDMSKLSDPEVQVFDEFTPKLADMEYGSDEYRACSEAMGPALEHHYAHNRHHPEHYEDGVAGMSCLDIVEMICDWKAASERMRPPAPGAPGRTDAPAYTDDFDRSLKLNQERFGYGDEVAGIIRNTAVELGFFVSKTTLTELIASNQGSST